MRPPRLPGMEKFRFCDKKFDSSSSSSSSTLIHNILDDNVAEILIKEDEDDLGTTTKKATITDKRISLPRRSASIKTTFTSSTSSDPFDDIYSLSHSLSNDSLPCCSFSTTSTASSSQSSGEFNKNESVDDIHSVHSMSTTVSNSLLIDDYLQINPMISSTLTSKTLTNKRKPKLPISSRMNSGRLFSMTSCIRSISCQPTTLTPPTISTSDYEEEEIEDDEDVDTDDNLSNNEGFHSHLHSSHSIHHRHHHHHNHYRIPPIDRASLLMSRSPTPNSLVSDDSTTSTP